MDRLLSITKMASKYNGIAWPPCTGTLETKKDVMNYNSLSHNVIIYDLDRDVLAMQTCRLCNPLRFTVQYEKAFADFQRKLDQFQRLFWIHSWLEMFIFWRRSILWGLSEGFLRQIFSERKSFFSRGLLFPCVVSFSGAFKVLSITKCEICEKS